MRELPKYLGLMFLAVVVTRITDVFHTISGDALIINLFLAGLFPFTAAVMFAIYGLAAPSQRGIKNLSATIGLGAVMADGFFNTIAALHSLRVELLNVEPALARIAAYSIGIAPSVFAVLLAMLAAMLAKQWKNKRDLPWTKFVRTVGGGNFGRWLGDAMPWNRPQAGPKAVFSRQCDVCGKVFRKASDVGAANALRSHQRPSTACGKKLAASGRTGQLPGPAGHHRALPGNYPATPSSTGQEPSNYPKEPPARVQ